MAAFPPQRPGDRLGQKLVQIAVVQMTHGHKLYALDENGVLWSKKFGEQGSTWAEVGNPYRVVGGIDVQQAADSNKIRSD